MAINKIDSKLDTLVILAGGLGTRLAEETKKKPKPMVEIGRKPILWHIIKHYEHYGFKNIIICAGYKREMIKIFFKKNIFKDIKINVIDTGLNSLTARRLIKIKKLLPENFCLTYGDAVSDIDIQKLVKFHFDKNSIFTISGVIPVSKYGSIKYDRGNKIIKFMEKSDFIDNFVSGGYFVLNKKIFKFINNKKNLMLEKEPMTNIAKTGKMYIYKHYGFWQCMDTLRDKLYLEDLWKKSLRWKIWKN
jgi:glucose-1-phosphate cytidylyltransferase|tara:strand:+ start:363 stop:1103 length:741 start_codon:yes stop_codon:yes gene_type:complete